MRGPAVVRACTHRCFVFWTFTESKSNLDEKDQRISCVKFDFPANACQNLQIGIPHMSLAYDIEPFLRENAIRVAGGSDEHVFIPADFTKVGRGGEGPHHV